MNVFVGLVLMQMIEGVMMAFVKVRGKWDFEGNKPGTYPGCLEIPCRGEVLKEESEWAALDCEIRESLGDWFGDYFQGHRGNTLRLISSLSSGNARTKIYALILPEEFNVNAGIKLSPSTGGLLPLDEAMLREITETTPQMEIGGPGKDVLAVSKEDMETLRGAFQVSKWANV